MRFHTLRTTFLGKLSPAIGLPAMVLLLSQCSDTTAPPPPSSITIRSGDNQFSIRGTVLPDPLEVAVLTAQGAAAQNVTVNFSVIEGGGTVSSGSAQTNDQGVASTQLTLGLTLGTNRVRAAIDAGVVVFEATASNFLCPEADDSLQVCGSCAASYGPAGQLFLATNKSSLFASAGIVNINPFGIPPTARSFTEIPPRGIFPAVIWDVAFSPRGDFYLAARYPLPEIIKIGTDGSLTTFTALDATENDDAVEITTSAIGLLTGVSKRGPFAVGCRDVLTRFPVATFAGGVNTDAVAVDPRDQTLTPFGEDIYFILETDSTLYRLALDSLTVETTRGMMGLEAVAQLTFDEATGANGMVCDGFDGTVYILVDTPATKHIVSVTEMGIRTIFFDFLTALPGGGAQRDLALKRPLLFTLDTLNDQLLVIDLAQTLTPLFSDSLEQIKLSSPMDSGDFVGLDVLR